MGVRRNFQAYHESIAAELQATQDRIRNLIGSSHWVTDGEHKEAILRNILRKHLPEIYKVASGFVITENESTGQIDILVIAKSASTLFKADEVLLVTPEGVKAIVEVKTRLRADQFPSVLGRLARNAELIRTTNPACWVGLFAYKPNREQLQPEHLLAALDTASEGNERRAINCVALGPQLFARFWSKGDFAAEQLVERPRWHAYQFPLEEASGMAHAYFISNLVWASSIVKSSLAAKIWFPIQRGSGKEDYLIVKRNLGRPASNNQDS